MWYFQFKELVLFVCLFFIYLFVVFVVVGGGGGNLYFILDLTFVHTYTVGGESTSYLSIVVDKILSFVYIYINWSFFLACCFFFFFFCMCARFM